MILDHGSRRWLPYVGATVVLALALTACGDDAPAATTAAPSGSVTTAAPDATGTTSAPAADTGLADAIAAVGTRYGFTADVTLDGVVVTRVVGTVYDGDGSYLVAAGGSEVEYVVSNQGQWAREAGGDWTLLSSAAPLVDPLGPLATPLSSTVLHSNGDDAVVEAVYDGASLGFSSGGEVTVTVTITNGAVSSISYDATVDDRLATVVTTFDPTADVAPIEVPPNQ